METNALKKLYIDELKDLFSAENQLVKALPKMAKAATSEELRSAFEEHLEQTRDMFPGWKRCLSSWTKALEGKRAKAWRD